MIRAYGFYGYSPGLAPPRRPRPAAHPHHLGAGGALRARRGPRAPPLDRRAAVEEALTGALVTFDAFAHRAHRRARGPLALDRARRDDRPRHRHRRLGLLRLRGTWLLAAPPPARRWAMIPLSLVASHALVLALWWGGLRWVLRDELPLSTTAPALAFCATLYTVAVVRRRARGCRGASSPRGRRRRASSRRCWRAGPTRRWCCGRRSSRRRGWCSARGRCGRHPPKTTRPNLVDRWKFPCPSSGDHASESRCPSRNVYRFIRHVSPALGGAVTRDVSTAPHGSSISTT
jgi:hypothetical protein